MGKVWGTRSVFGCAKKRVTNNLLSKRHNLPVTRPRSIKMNSRSAGPSTTKRQRTPVSPSPSPEPVEGAGASALAPPFAHDPAGLGNTNGGADSIHPSSNATVVALEPAQEAARKAIEERCRVAVDDLMQLATCAAEVHLGDEDIVRLKV